MLSVTARAQLIPPVASSPQSSESPSIRRDLYLIEHSELRSFYGFGSFLEYLFAVAPRHVRLHAVLDGLPKPTRFCIYRRTHAGVAPALFPV